RLEWRTFGAVRGSVELMSVSLSKSNLNGHGFTLRRSGRERKAGGRAGMSRIWNKPGIRPSFAPSFRLIRSGLALRTTRGGQMVDDLGQGNLPQSGRRGLRIQCAYGLGHAVPTLLFIRHCAIVFKVL